MPPAPPAFTVAFAALSPVTAAAAWLFLFRRAHVDGRASALLLAWIALTGGLAAAGVLAVFEPFPRLMPLFVVGLLGVGVLAFGRAGARLVDALSVAALVGLQVFGPEAGPLICPAAPPACKIPLRPRRVGVRPPERP